MRRIVGYRSGFDPSVFLATSMTQAHSNSFCLSHASSKCLVSCCCLRVSLAAFWAWKSRNSQERTQSATGLNGVDLLSIVKATIEGGSLIVSPGALHCQRIASLSEGSCRG